MSSPRSWRCMLHMLHDFSRLYASGPRQRCWDNKRIQRICMIRDRQSSCPWVSSSLPSLGFACVPTSWKEASVVWYRLNDGMNRLNSWNQAMVLDWGAWRWWELGKSGNMNEYHAILFAYSLPILMSGDSPNRLTMSCKQSLCHHDIKNNHSPYFTMQGHHALSRSTLWHWGHAATHTMRPAGLSLPSLWREFEAAQPGENVWIYHYHKWIPLSKHIIVITCHNLCTSCFCFPMSLQLLSFYIQTDWPHLHSQQ